MFKKESRPARQGRRRPPARCPGRAGVIGLPGSPTLTHCGLADEPARAPPQDASAALGELQYVSDLEFVQDPGPAEPVWSAD